MYSKWGKNTPLLSELGTWKVKSYHCHSGAIHLICQAPRESSVILLVWTAYYEGVAVLVEERNVCQYQDVSMIRRKMKIFTSLIKFVAHLHRQFPSSV